jgi:hypothetical protein
MSHTWHGAGRGFTKPSRLCEHCNQVTTDWEIEKWPTLDPDGWEVVFVCARCRGNDEGGAS